MSIIEHDAFSQHFSEKIEAMRCKLQLLSGDINGSVTIPEDPSIGVSQQSEMVTELQVAMEGLHITLKELWTAKEQLEAQSAELRALHFALENERKCYRDLFESAPDSLLVGDTSGIIRTANLSACRLLGVESKLMVGVALASFIHPDEQQMTRARLCQSLHRLPQEWLVSLRLPTGSYLPVSLMVSALKDPADRLNVLQFQLRPVARTSPPVAAAGEGDFESQPLYVYYKGEAVPSKPQGLWLVRQGVVKLSTLRFSGEEVLLGLAGPGTVFGAGLTRLQSYQALALSDVQLLGFTLEEIQGSPRLMRIVYPLIQQRLQHSESLLAIAGQLQSEDRLRDLLLLLKEEIGQPVAEGTKLTVRLMHQDLANGISATRVTVSNQLSKLRKRGLISIDSKQHIVLSDKLSADE